MDINFEYYKIFYYVAKYESITMAAKALTANQPNVTRIIKLLESQLNCRLFVRESRGIKLTLEGKRLYHHVKMAYEHLMDGENEICSQEFRGSGTIKIGATETAIHMFLLDTLYEFKRQYPKMSIKVHNSTTPQIIKQLKAGSLDMALVTTPVKIPENYIGVCVKEFSEILVAGTLFGDVAKRKTSLKQLENLPWVGLGRETATYTLYKKYFKEYGVSIEPDTEVATSDLLIPFIKNNFGLGFVPEALTKKDIAQSSLVHIKLEESLPVRKIMLIVREKDDNMAVKTFRGYLKDERND